MSEKLSVVSAPGLSGANTSATAYVFDHSGASAGFGMRHRGEVRTVP